MSRNHTLDFKKLIVTDTACLLGQTVIGGDVSGKTCGSLNIRTDAVFEEDVTARRFIPRHPNENFYIDNVIVDPTNQTLDLNCHAIKNIMNLTVDHIDPKEGQIINSDTTINITETSKIILECGLQLGDQNTSTTDCTGVSVGKNTSTGFSSVAVGSNAGNDTGNENTCIGYNAGNLVTGSNNINIGPNSTSKNNVNNTVTIGCDAVAEHEGAIIIGPGTSCEANMLHLNFASGGGVYPGAPPGTVPAYLTICVNGEAFQVFGYLDENCYDPILTAFSQTFTGADFIRGQNLANGNKQILQTILDKYTGEPATLGGFLVKYDAPGDTVMGSYNYVSGLRIIDFASATPITMTMFDMSYSLYVPQNTNPSPPPECPSGWLVQTTPILKWADAVNVQYTNNGTTLDITWDNLLSAQEYAISATIVGYVNNSQAATHYYGKFLGVPNTSVTLDISSTGNPGSYWTSITSITPRVIGYEICDKGLTATDHCVDIIVPNQSIKIITSSNPAAESPFRLGRFTVTLTAASAVPITVNFSVTGTAVLGVNYTISPSTSVVFSPGQTSQTITVTPINDMVIGTNLTVIATLTGASGNAYYILSTVPSELTATVNVVDTAPAVKGSLYFPGNATNAMLYPFSTDFASSGDWTIEWYQYMQFTSNTHRMFDNGSHRYLWSGNGNSGSWEHGGWFIGGSAPSFIRPNTVNRWAHVAFMKQGGTKNMYIDGVYIWNLNPSGFGDGGGAWTIGNNFSPSISAAFKGYITNFRYTRSVVYPLGGFAPPTTTLTALPNTILLLTASNPYNYFEDSSGTNKIATVSGGVIWQAASPFP